LIWLATALLVAAAVGVRAKEVVDADGVSRSVAQAPLPAPIELAAGVYMVRGSTGEPEPANLGRVGNAGFIVGRTGVLAIDTGTSYLHGRALLAAIRTVTDQPVRIALITHTRQEFLFGAAAFREQGIPIAMQQAAAGLMASRCETCLKTLRDTLGEEAMRGTTMFKPDVAFVDPLGINVAAMIGRPIQLLYYGHSSGPGDIAVYDPRTRTLFAGGLLDAQRIPDVIDSDLPRWNEALRSLQALPIDVIVPGHGPSGGKRVITQVERYLDQLTARARALLKAGAPLSEVPDATALPDFAAWDQYDTVHRRNAALVYLRYEREQLIK
jgi:glyoxylase-like metal-dependent hydrolase (beta-lactamase superfamily II)